MLDANLSLHYRLIDIATKNKLLATKTLLKKKYQRKLSLFKLCKYKIKQKQKIQETATLFGHDSPLSLLFLFLLSLGVFLFILVVFFLLLSLVFTLAAVSLQILLLQFLAYKTSLFCIQLFE